MHTDYNPINKMKNRINSRIWIVLLVLVAGLFLGGCTGKTGDCDNGGDEQGSICAIAKQLSIVSKDVLNVVSQKTEDNCFSLKTSSNYLKYYLDGFRPNEVFDTISFNWNDQAAIDNIVDTLGSSIDTAKPQIVAASQKNTLTSSISITKYTVGDSGGVFTSSETVTVSEAYSKAIGYLGTAESELNNIKSTVPSRENIYSLQDDTINVKSALLSFYGAVAGIQAETCKDALDLKACEKECCPENDPKFLKKDCPAEKAFCCQDGTCKENLQKCFAASAPTVSGINPTCLVPATSVGPTGTQHIVCQATTGTSGVCTVVQGAGTNDPSCTGAFAACTVSAAPVIPGMSGGVPVVPPVTPTPGDDDGNDDNEECDEITGLAKCPQDFEQNYNGKTFKPTEVLDTRDKGFCDSFGDYPNDFDVGSGTLLKVTDSALKDGSCWLYVQAQDSSGGYKPEFYVKYDAVKKYFTSSQTQTPTPKNLHVKEKDSTSITLEWDPMTVQEADLFMVFRNNVNIINVTTNTYKDTGLVENTQYSYYVKAYSNKYDIKESLPSNTITETLGGACEITSIVVTPQCTTCRLGDTLKVVYQTKGNCPSELFLEIVAKTNTCVFPGK
jgi:hypothetical protein